MHARDDVFPIHTKLYTRGNHYLYWRTQRGNTAHTASHKTLTSDGGAARTIYVVICIRVCVCVYYYNNGTRAHARTAHTPYAIQLTKPALPVSIENHTAHTHTASPCGCAVGFWPIVFSGGRARCGTIAGASSGWRQMRNVCDDDAYTRRDAYA